MTPAGIEPATFRFVAQRLNHCATAVPMKHSVDTKILTSEFLRHEKFIITKFFITFHLYVLSQRIFKLISL